MEPCNTPGSRVETVSGATGPEETKELFESTTQKMRQDQVKDNCDFFGPCGDASEINVNDDKKGQKDVEITYTPSSGEEICQKRKGQNDIIRASLVGEEFC